MLTDVNAPKRASYADLVALPENKVGEIVDGTLFASPRPAARHALAASALGAELSGPLQFGRGGPGGWWILFEPELHLVEDVMVPDLAGWRRERMPEVPDEAFFTLAPDWVCEVLSPSTAKLDLALKLPRYAKAGVAHAWLVEPKNRTLEVFDLGSGAPVLVSAFAGEDRVRAPPFESVEIALGLLWGGEP
jgi:Uma2 family endonuclease